MYISHAKKIIFLAIPKTGSVSIRDSLIKHIGQSDRLIGDLGNNDHHVHPGAIQMALKRSKTSLDWSEYFKFAFVRNPWAREVSVYNYRIKSVKVLVGDNLTPQQIAFRNYNEQYLKTCPTFKSAIQNYNKVINSHHIPMHKWTHDKDLNQIVDFIGKLENIDTDYNTVCQLNDIPLEQLHKNKSKHKHYTEYYDDETREIVANKYKDDIELFGYQFEK
jgi:hypothetical protein